PSSIVSAATRPLGQCVDSTTAVGASNRLVNNVICEPAERVESHDALAFSGRQETSAQIEAFGTLSYYVFARSISPVRRGARSIWMPDSALHTPHWREELAQSLQDMAARRWIDRLGY